MNYEILIAILHFVFAFVITLVLTKWWIKIAKKNELVGNDMNKYVKKPVAESGGIAVMISIILTILLYIFFKTFIIKTEMHFVEILIFSICLLLAALIGFVDDMLGWKKGLRPYQKMLMSLPVAIPLMVINAGQSIMFLPFIGSVDFGILYPLLIIPIGVLGAVNGVNILAGYNGLETGLGVIIIGTLGVVALLQNSLWLALIAAIIVFSLLGFLIFNKFPARVFPGDSLTYSIGAMIALFAILGNMEKIALILFVPFILEGILKARSKFKAENWGKVNKDNSLEVPYKKIYSLTHLSLKLLKKIKPSHKVYEKDVVLSLWFFEIILAVLIFLFVI